MGNWGKQVREIFASKAPDFSFQEAPLLDLCIQLGDREFAYMLINRETGTPRLLQHFEIQAPNTTDLLTGLMQLQGFLDVFQYAYKRVAVNLHFEVYSPVPEALILADKEHLLWTLQHEQWKSIPFSMMEDENKFSGDFRLYYGIPNEIKYFIDRCFIHPRYKHVHSVLLHYMQRKQAAACIHLDEQRLFVQVFSEKGLLMMNCFPYESPEDVLFFTAASLEKHGHVPSESTIHISGRIEAGSAIFVLLQQYIKDVRLAETDSYSGSAATIPTSHYLPLIHRIHCV